MTKTQYWAARIGVSLVSAVSIGLIYKADKKAEERIQDKYESQKPKK